MKKIPTAPLFDPAKYIQFAQAGGIEAYTIDEGAGRGVRALCVNTGGGLRFRVLVDRGLDIDHAFHHQHSLTFLTHKGVTAPTRGLDRGLGWIANFPGGLLTSCGPFNIGKPGIDDGEELGQHGPHSNTAATLESVVQPDPWAGRNEMSIVGSVRHGSFYGPIVEMRRTIRCTLGSNAIEFIDEFFNAGNQRIPHAWLLHINFGYPLLDGGAEFCYDASKIESMDDAGSMERFTKSSTYKKVLGPMESNRGPDSAVGYLYPRPRDRKGNTTVGIVNRKLGLGAAIHYNTAQFPRCGNWQHFGPGEYVSALEPMNGTVDGRWLDRQRGLLDFIEAGGRRKYEYRIEVVTDRKGLGDLLALNRR